MKQLKTVLLRCQVVMLFAVMLFQSCENKEDTVVPDVEVIANDLGLDLEKLRQDGLTEGQIREMIKRLHSAEEVTEASLKEQRKIKAASQPKTEQNYDNFNFNSETFKTDLINHFEYTTNDLPFNTQDLLDLEIIDQGTYQNLQSNNTVKYGNKKFTQYCSNVYRGHHKNNDPYQRILSASMKILDENNNDRQLKLWQDSDGHGDKVYDSDKYLYWDVKKVLNYKATTKKDQLGYASTQYPSYVPNALQTGTNGNATKSIKDILGINDNKWTTIDINEGWSKSTTKTNTYTTSITLGYEQELKTPVGTGTGSLEVGFTYERSRAMERTRSWQVNSEIAFFVPDLIVPPNYKFRLHPVMGYDKTTITYDLKGVPTGQIRTYHRTNSRNSSNYERKTDLGLIPEYKDHWSDWWNSGVAYNGSETNKFGYSTQEFEVYDLSSGVDVTTGIEIYDGTYNDESKLLLRENVPGESNIDRYFRHPNDQINSNQNITYQDVKRLSVVGGKLEFKFHNTPPTFSGGHLYVIFTDQNGNVAYYKLNNAGLGTIHTVDLSNPYIKSTNFSLNKVKKMQFYTSTTKNIEFSAYIK